MGEGGLLVVHETTSQQDPTPTAFAERLTWMGYEFLDASRQSVVWAKGKELAARAGITSFEFILEALKRVAMQQAGWIEQP